MLIVRSPVRISFGGGGTDLPAYYEKYSGAVLSTTINKYFYTTLTRRNDDKIQVISSDLRTIETWSDLKRQNLQGTALEIPLAVLREFHCDAPLDLFLASEIPPGTGLGSSASVCVGILKALSVYLRRSRSRQEIAETAFHIARHTLGRPVGKQDEYAASFGGLNYITFHRDGTTVVDPVVLDPQALHTLQSRLMLFFTGAAHNSWQILNEQERAANDSSPSLTSLQAIHRFAAEMRDAITSGDLRSFGRLLDEGWQAKRRLSSKISNSRIDQLYEIARQHGALGGKITGAGGGGFLLLYCEDDAQPTVRKALAQEGLREMTFELDTKGAHVLVNDPFLDGDARCGLTWTFRPLARPA
jgi:D-glycero-alpha-D-manno-heptose-7-phosphate kinase